MFLTPPPPPVYISMVDMIWFLEWLLLKDPSLVVFARSHIWLSLPLNSCLLLCRNASGYGFDPNQTQPEQLFACLDLESRSKSKNRPDMDFIQSPKFYPESDSIYVISKYSSYIRVKALYYLMLWSLVMILRFKPEADLFASLLSSLFSKHYALVFYETV